MADMIFNPQNNVVAKATNDTPKQTNSAPKQVAAASKAAPTTVASKTTSTTKDKKNAEAVKNLGVILLFVLIGVLIWAGGMIYNYASTKADELKSVQPEAQWEYVVPNEIAYAWHPADSKILKIKFHNYLDLASLDNEGEYRLARSDEEVERLSKLVQEGKITAEQFNSTLISNFLAEDVWANVKDFAILGNSITIHFKEEIKEGFYFLGYNDPSTNEEMWETFIVFPKECPQAAEATNASQTSA